LILSVDTGRTECFIKMVSGEEYSVIPKQFEDSLDRIGDPKYNRIIKRLERMQREARKDG